MSDHRKRIERLEREAAKEDKEDVVRFVAQVSKVTTLADGGIRVVLDLAETEIETARAMMEARQRGAVLEVAAIPIDKQIKDNGRKQRKADTVTGNTSATY